jgi:hypothetical protein
MNKRIAVSKKVEDGERGDRWARRGLFMHFRREGTRGGLDRDVYRRVFSRIYSTPLLPTTVRSQQMVYASNRGNDSFRISNLIEYPSHCSFSAPF